VKRPKQSSQATTELRAGGKTVELAWQDTSKAHRDRAARRKMIKFFLADLYARWRLLEGLHVREPYAVEYLNRRHAVAA
jgi:hypothetical protein